MKQSSCEINNHFHYCHWSCNFLILYFSAFVCLIWRGDSWNFSWTQIWGMNEICHKHFVIYHKIAQLPSGDKKYFALKIKYLFPFEPILYIFVLKWCFSISIIFDPFNMLFFRLSYQFHHLLYIFLISGVCPTVNKILLIDSLYSVTSQSAK